MTDIQTQYSTGASRQAIEQALVAAGKDLDHLRLTDLALLEDFHTMGRIATAQLVGLVEITPGDQVLDAGSGIGGTARYLAGRSGCHVVAVDLTEEYCATARWLNQLARLDDRISVRQGSVTDLPFEDAAFTLMFSQHVQMNVADKALLYKEARRVLVSGGRLALWDIVAGGGGEPDFPVPWADRPDYSHLTTADGLRTAIGTSGFEIEQWNDLTGDDVPYSQPAAGDEDPACLLVQQSLVGHVHLNVLAEHQCEGRLVERQVGDVCLAHRDPVIKPGKLVEPPSGLTVFRGEIHGGHVAAAAFGDVAGGSADSAARVEDLVLGGDLDQVGQLGGGDAAHRVEVLKQSEVRGPKVAEVFPCLLYTSPSPRDS